MSNSTTNYTRFLAPRVVASLEDTPVTLIHGPRQSGKTTLAKMVGGPRGYDYFSFDDDVIRDAAASDPIGFVADLPEKAILDEVQRVPSLFNAIKLIVDRDRRPGRLILTGSANVLLVPKLSESLAGRMGILRLHPLAQCELEAAEPKFLDALFTAQFPTRSADRLGPALADRIVAGGYPAALARPSEKRRAAWYRDYVETQLQKDVRDFGRIRSLDALPRLLALASGHTAQLINVSELAAPFQLTRQTISDYVTLLERVFLIDRLAPWHNNRLSRLVKTPKLHVGDTGLACAVLGFEAAGLYRDRGVLGAMVETFVYQELRRQASWRDSPVTFHHFRDRDGVEVDIVLEVGASEVVGVEVKVGATVSASDFRGLRKLKDAARERFVCGVVLYDGENAVKFGDRLHAVPIRCLWDDTSN